MLVHRALALRAALRQRVWPASLVPVLGLQGSRDRATVGRRPAPWLLTAPVVLRVASDRRVVRMRPLAATPRGVDMDTARSRRGHRLRRRDLPVDARLCRRARIQEHIQALTRVLHRVLGSRVMWVAAAAAQAIRGRLRLTPAPTPPTPEWGPGTVPIRRRMGPPRLTDRPGWMKPA